MVRQTDGRAARICFRAPTIINDINIYIEVYEYHVNLADSELFIELRVQCIYEK